MFYPNDHKIRTIWEYTKKLQGEYLVKEEKVHQLELTLRTVRKQLQEQLFADLIVKSIVPTLFTNFARIVVTVQNIDRGNSTACNLQVTVSSSTFNLTIPDLGYLQTADLSFDFIFDSTGTPIVYSVSATANDPQTIVESNYTNNNLVESITLKTPHTYPPGNGGIITHIHNPEGIELNYISQQPIWFGITHLYPAIIDTYLMVDYNLGAGAYNDATHNLPYTRPAGVHTITAMYNSYQLSETFNLADGETKILEFTFPRLNEITNIGFIADQQIHNNQPIDIPLLYPPTWLVQYKNSAFPNYLFGSLSFHSGPGFQNMISTNGELFIEGLVSPLHWTSMSYYLNYLGVGPEIFVVTDIPYDLGTNGI